MGISNNSNVSGQLSAGGRSRLLCFCLLASLNVGAES